MVAVVVDSRPRTFAASLTAGSSSTCAVIYSVGWRGIVHQVSGAELRLLLATTAADEPELTAWPQQFQWGAATMDCINEPSEIATALTAGQYDVCLLVDHADGATALSWLRQAIAQGRRGPYLLLFAQENPDLLYKAVQLGAAALLPLVSLDAITLERSIHVAYQTQLGADHLIERELYLTAGRERDRQRLAQDLHDGPLQDLIGARFQVGLLATLLNDKSLQPQIAELQDGLQGVIQAVRELCGQLRPPALAPFGLEKAMRAYAQSFQLHYPHLSIELELTPDRKELPEWVRFALFRIYQYTVDNVARHADATQVWVRLQLNEQQVRLVVADDGQGFELPENWLEFARTERFGLLNVQECADAIGGRLMVQSAPGNGTRVTVQAPLPQPAALSPRWSKATLRNSAPA